MPLNWPALSYQRSEFGRKKCSTSLCGVFLHSSQRHQPPVGRNNNPTSHVGKQTKLHSVLKLEKLAESSSKGLSYAAFQRAPGRGKKGGVGEINTAPIFFKKKISEREAIKERETRLPGTTVQPADELCGAPRELFRQMSGYSPSQRSAGTLLSLGQSSE